MISIDIQLSKSKVKVKCQAIYVGKYTHSHLIFCKMPKLTHFAKSYTVNVVIFVGGKFRENASKTFHMGVIFTILLLSPSLRHIDFIFVWG